MNSENYTNPRSGPDNPQESGTSYQYGPGQQSGPGQQYGWVPPTPRDPRDGTHGGRQFFDAMRRSGYFRSQSRWIGGVAGGLARRFNVDPLIARVIILVLCLATGLGAIAYAAAWILLPEERDGRIHAEEMIRGNFDGALIGAGILTLLGLGNLYPFVLRGAGLPWPFTLVFWLAFIALAIYLVQQIKEHRGQANPQGNWTPPAAAMPSQDNTAADTAAGTAASAAAETAAGSAAETAAGTATSSAADTKYQPYQSYESYESYQWNDRGTWQPPKPTKPLTKSPGAIQGAFLLGVILLTSMGLFIAERQGALASDVHVVGLIAGIALALCGLTVVFNGLRGWSSGSGGFIAILALIATMVSGMFMLPGFSGNHGHFRPFTDHSYTPTSIDEVTDGYSFGIGSVSLDLTDLPFDSLGVGDTPLVVDIEGGIGDLTIHVPSTIGVTATTDLGIGSISDPNQSSGGVGNSTIPFSNTIASQNGPVVLKLNIDMGVGDVSIVEEKP